jgi:hypothetical protein
MDFSRRAIETFDLCVCAQWELRMSASRSGIQDPQPLNMQTGDKFIDGVPQELPDVNGQCSRMHPEIQNRFVIERE